MATVLKTIQAVCVGLITLIVLCVATLVGFMTVGFVYVFQFIAIGLAVLVGGAYFVWELFTSKPKK